MTQWPVLASLSSTERAELLSAGRRRRFARGEVVFHHGDPADSLHLLDVGRVAVRVLTARGEQAILTVLGPGSVFGELALIDPHAQRSATITAVEPTETIALRESQFQELLRRHPQVNAFLLASLAAQVNRLSEHLLEVLFSPSPRRLCQRLLTLDQEFGQGPITITQEDLALMVGVSRATANEILGELERAGVVAVGRRRIDILDRTRLRQRSGTLRA